MKSDSRGSIGVVPMDSCRTSEYKALDVLSVPEGWAMIVTSYHPSSQRSRE